MTDLIERTGAHVQELKLRRFSIGESLGAETPAVEAHTAACPQCRARLKEFTEEQRRFEQELSFDGFAAGVERAARTPRTLPARRPSRGGRWLYPALSMAAAVALLVTVAPRLRPPATGRGGDAVVAPINRVKGGAGITVQIAPAPPGPQRTAPADAPEPLAPGDRLRIGYQPGGHGYLTALSIDDQGQVTPLYPESGRSLPVAKSTAPAATVYLPDSVELTGRGVERLIVILGDQPLEAPAAAAAARAAYQKAKGDLVRLAPLELPGEQFHRLFLKP